MVIALSREHNERPALACHADAATIDRGHGSPTQGNHIRGVRFYRPFWEDRLTATTPSQGLQPATSPSSGPPNPLMPEEIADRTVPSDPRISPDGSRDRLRRVASEQDRREMDAIALDRG